MRKTKTNHWQSARRASQWIAYFVLLIVFPGFILWELLPHRTDVFPQSTFQRRWEMRGVDMYIENDGFIPIINDVVLYGSDTPELKTTKLDFDLKVPKTFIAKLLKLPEEPVPYDLCIELQSYYEGSNGARVSVSDQTVRLLIEGMPVQELHDGDCLASQSGMTLIGVAPGAIPMESFSEGINKTGVIVFSGANIQVDNANQGSGETVFSYRGNENSLMINGQIFQGSMSKTKDGSYMEIDWSDKNLILKVKSVQELKIFARPFLKEWLLLATVLLTAWWVLIWSLIGNIQKAWGVLVTPLVPTLRIWTNRIWRRLATIWHKWTHTQNASKAS